MKIKKEDLKKFSTDFFFYWFNKPGSNTLDGFDAFFIEKLISKYSRNQIEITADDCEHFLRKHTKKWEEAKELLAKVIKSDVIIPAISIYDELDSIIYIVDGGDPRDDYEEAISGL